MKILHIINNLGSGGAEKLIEQSIPIMNNIENVEVDLLLLTDKGNVFDKELEELGVNIDIISLKQIKNPFNILYIKKYIINGKYDVVHAHLFPTVYWVSIASKLIFKNRPKFIYTEHSTHNRRREKIYLKPLEKWIYSNYNKIISISDSTQKNLINWLKPRQKSINKFIIINNGINIKKFKEAEAYEKSKLNNRFTNDIKLLCMVGRFSEAKNQGTIIRAMEGLPEYVHLLLIGEGPLRSHNEKLAKDIGVSDRVHFLGFRNDVERILKTSDIIIQSSNWEGFGLAAVEGMAAGKPVIASDVDGLRDVVDGAGLLFEKGNADELADKINLLMNDESHCKVYRDSCINRADKYEIISMLDKIIKIYKANI